MAVYGYSIYGTSLYGPDSNAFTTDLFTASPSGFGQISLSWNAPGGQWRRMRLVRSLFGTPVDQEDGVVLFDINSGPAAPAPADPSRTSYVDAALPAGRPAYYSIFVQAIVGLSRVWYRAANSEAYAVKDHGYQNYLLNRLPPALSSATGSGSPSSSPDADSPLASFLGIVGFDLSRYRDLLDGVLLAADPTKVDGTLLPLLCAQYGFAFEPEIGMRQNRVLAKGATYLHQIKGTAQSALGLTSAVTGYGVLQLPWVNLMLSSDDSSGDFSIGGWRLRGGLLARVATVTPPRSDSPKGGTWGTLLNGQWADVTGYTWQQVMSATAIDPAATAALQRPGVFEILAESTSLQLDLGLGDPVGTGIPVDPSAWYTFSAHILSAAVSRRPILSILWYDQHGTLLNTTTASSAVAPTTTVDGKWGRSSVTGYSPGAAAFASLRVSYATVAVGEIQYLDAFQFEPGAAVSPYRAPRELRLGLVATRVNEIVNPGFDISDVGWSAGADSAIYRDTATVYGGGVASLQVINTTLSLQTIVASTPFSVDSNKPFVTTAQVMTTDVNQQITMSVAWSDANGNALPASTTTVAGIQNQWQRVIIQTTTPVGAATGVLSFTVTNVAAGTGYDAQTYDASLYGGSPGAFYIDDVLAEITTMVQDYFDLTTNPGDVYFENGFSVSRSHLYPNSLVKKSRLLDLLTDMVPLNTNLSLVLALPRSTLHAWATLAGASWDEVTADKWSGPYTVTSAAASVDWNQLQGSWNSLNTWVNP